MELKSKPQSTIKISAIIWTLCIVLAFISIGLFFFSYKKYSTGQQFAINAAREAGIHTVSDEKSNKENCEELYGYLTAKYFDLTIKDTTYDFSELRGTMSKFKDAFAEAMYEAGHKKYDAYGIENWFKYPSMASFFFGEYAFSPLFIIFYIVLICTIVWTSIVRRFKKKSLIVSENSLTIINGKSSIQKIMLEDIQNVTVSKNKIKIKGDDIKVVVSHLGNAEELKERILQNKLNLKNEVPLIEDIQLKDLQSEELQKERN